MTIWLISTRVNKPDNDDPSILDRTAEPADWQAPLDRSDRAFENKIQRTSGRRWGLVHDSGL